MDTKHTTLLTALEEKSLGQLIQAGLRAQRQIRHSKGMCRQRLHQQITDGRAAEAELIERNLRLVKWLLRGKSQRQECDDLFQEGAVGLHHAARKWNPQRGFRFATYATWWVRQAIQRGRNQFDLIHVPIRVRERIAFHQRKEQQTTPRLRREHAPAEVFSCAGDSETLMAGRKILNSNFISLDDLDAHEWLIESPEQCGTVRRDEITQVVRRVLASHPHKWQQAIVLHYGLSGQRPHDYHEIGRAIGVSAASASNYVRRGHQVLRQQAGAFKDFISP